MSSLGGLGRSEEPASRRPLGHPTGFAAEVTGFARGLRHEAAGSVGVWRFPTSNVGDPDLETPWWFIQLVKSCSFMSTHIYVLVVDDV